ncbi:MAG: hypothetical protein JEZ05_08220 [Tenericutes bacterium]|nr:hypothetical protein [Mycoplasmatota bacterium]
MPNQNRKVVSTRMKPAVIEKLDCLVDQFNIDTPMFRFQNILGNKHTVELGYGNKIVTRSDVLEILINKAYNKIHKL